jgi:hypothetical protein
MTEDGQFSGGNPPQGVQFQGGGSGFTGGGTSGQVKTIEGNVMTVSTAQDVAMVNLTDKTLVEKTVEGAIADLKPGMQVMVIGERDADGNITASQISILGNNPFRFEADQQTPDPLPAGTEP